MRRCIFKAVGLALLLQALPAAAQETAVGLAADTVAVAQKWRAFWGRLVPTHYRLQGYGNIGAVSAGPGWDYGRRRQWSTDFSIGLVPKYSSDRARVCLALRQTYIPWHKSLGGGLVLEPLQAGMFVSTILGDKFWGKEPDRYPSNYYGFSTRVRLHVFVGQALAYRFRHKLGPFRSAGVFYEINSCDLYIISAFTNHLSPKDYLRLAFGLKLQTF